MQSKHEGKNNIIKTVSCIAAVAVIGTSISLLTYAAAKNDKDNSNLSTSDTSSVTEEKSSKVNKDETVYVLAGNDGSVKKIIVSDWIKNTLAAAKITDKTDLTNDKNIKGNESYTMNSDNMRVWDADGKDIYTQGTIEKSLPVDLSLSYKLDGKSITAKDLAGKSGKVTIRFDYKNNQFENVNIDGKQQKIYVPFVMLSGLLLDNEKFSNVNVTNGKVLNDGSHIAVIGFAMPGLQENLDLSKDKLEIPDYVEITADVKKFELSTTMTVATNSIFNEFDTSKLNSLDDITGSVSKLNTAMSQLLDGSSQLYAGTQELLNKSGALISGVNQLAEGSTALKAKMTELTGKSTQLDDGGKKLKVGAKTAFDATLAGLNKELNAMGITVTDKDYAEKLPVIVKQMTNPTDKEKAVVANMIKPLVVSELETAGVPKQYCDSAIVMIENFIMQNYTKYDSSDKLLAAAEDNMKSILEKATLVNNINKSSIAPNEIIKYYLIESASSDSKYTSLTHEQKVGLLNTDDYKNVKSGIDTLSKVCAYLAMMNNTEITNSNAIDYITLGKTYTDSATNVLTLGTSQGADAKITQFCLDTAKSKAPEIEQAKGLLDIYQGSITICDNLSALNVGISTIKEQGTDVLDAGINKLKSEAGALPSGVKALNDGAMQLSDGLKQFNKDGIKKISDLVNNDLSTIITRLKATVDVSKNYKSFAGISDESDGSVKFVYKTDEIK